MSNRRTTISVIGEIGVIQNLREQIVNLAQKNGTNIVGIAKKMKMAKSHVYLLLGAETIQHRHLITILKAAGASPKDLKVSKPGS